MSDEVVVEQTQDEAAELAAAQAGYERKSARGEQPPVETEPEPQEPPVEEVVEPEAPDPIAALKDEMAALKAKVSSVSTSDSDAVRKLHGEIGSINRTLQQMQAKPAAPVNDELTAALTSAESVAAEFPELAGPLVKAMKALGAAKQPQTEEVSERAKQAAIEAANDQFDRRQRQTAIEALVEEHPDYETVRDTPEFKAWEKTKTPEFIHKMWNTWNPAVVARGLTEFKDSLKAKAQVKQKKQDRLEAAVAPIGASNQPRSSTLPDDAGFNVGYNRVKSKSSINTR